MLVVVGHPLLKENELLLHMQLLLPFFPSTSLSDPLLHEKLFDETLEHQQQFKSVLKELLRQELPFLLHL